MKNENIVDHIKLFFLSISLVLIVTKFDLKIEGLAKEYYNSEASSLEELQLKNINYWIFNELLEWQKPIIKNAKNWLNSIELGYKRMLPKDSLKGSKTKIKEKANSAKQVNMFLTNFVE